MTTDTEIPIEIIPDATADENELNVDEVQDDTPLTKKELQKIEKQKQREAERAEKEQRKEEERKRKEEEKLRKEEEKIKKQKEKELKKQKIEEEKAEKERKRQEKEAKKEAERLEKEAKKEEERLAKQQAIEAKEQARLEKKRKLEEEKEEKLQKKRKLEEEKEEREVQRRKLEEEKKRKEESQMKISSFFTKKLDVASPQKVQKVIETTDYEREFLPLFVQKNMQVADLGKLSQDELNKSKDLFDGLLKSKENNFLDVQEFFISKRSVSVRSSTITPDDVVALLNSSTATEAAIYQVINQFPPIKFISFYENSKPPYVGTWCSLEHQKTRVSAKYPLDTLLTGLDYDYDSDLEWNKEDEEGEDVDDEDDEEEEDTIIADEDDLGFVEDDQQVQAKRFHSMNVIVKLNDGTNDDFFKLITTTPLVSLPINPFKTVQTESPVKAANTEKKKIEDPKIINQIITFYDSKELGSFSINTILELVMKNFEYTDKALVRNTLHHILRKDRQTSSWVVKKVIRADPSEVKAQE